MTHHPWSNPCGRALALAFWIVACGSPPLPQIERGEAPDGFGPWHVGHMQRVFTDPERGGRQLRVELWYPIDPEHANRGGVARYALSGPFSLESAVARAEAPVSRRGPRPLLIFSHGYGAPATQSTGLLEHLASHGFIAIAPAHTGNTFGSDRDAFSVAGANRVPDVSFLIDAMAALHSEPEAAFFERVDLTAVGVLGHSFGGMTALGVAGGWGESAPDPRVGAIAANAAVVVGDRQLDRRPPPYDGFTREQLASIAIPVLLLGGTEDRNVFIENNEIAFDWISAPVYRVDVVGANHYHFANVCEIGDRLRSFGIGRPLWRFIGAAQLRPIYAQTCTDEAFDIRRAQRLQKLYATAFFKRHLLERSEYGRYLTAEYAARHEDEVAFFRK